MFYKQTSRLLSIKFLGIFGSVGPQIPDRLTKDSKNTDNERSETQRAGEKCTLDNREIFNDAVEESNKKVRSLLLERGIPGLTICVAKRGKVVWQSAFGFSDVENQVACRPEARMRIASISKPLFVATIIGPLLDEGKIDLKESIYKFLSEEDFPKKRYDNKLVDITIEQLISHTAGISHYDEGDEDKKKLRPIGSQGSEKIYQNDEQFNRTGFFQRRTFRNVTEALESFKDAPLVNEPGQKYNYSTYGYTLLSAVVERVCKRVYGDKTSEERGKFQIEDFWMKVLRNEWRLEETSLDHDEPILPNRVRYYLRSGLNGRLINAPYTDLSVKWSGGGVISTTRDIVKFGNALIESYKGRQGAKLKKETINKLWEEVRDSYSLGFKLQKLNVDESGGEKFAVYHLGGALGASSALVIYPESEVVVAILCNLGEINLRPLGIFVANQFAKQQD